MTASQRHAPPKREQAPELIFRMPLCPLCEQDVEHDGDSFYCRECEFSWGTVSGEPGEPMNDDRRQCSATDRDSRCILDEGHTTAIVTPYLAGRGAVGANRFGIAEQRTAIHVGLEGRHGDRAHRWESR